MKKWVVTHNEHGRKLVNFIKDKLGDAFTARGIKRAIESNLCQVNGAMERFASRTLSTGDRVQLQGCHTTRAKVSITILYEDDAIFVCDKPAAVSVENFLKILHKQHPRLQLAHRLDKDTTGVLLLTKTTSALNELERQFRDREVKKTYLALVDGCPKEPSGVIENHLGKLHSYQGQTIWGAVPKTKGQLAITAWKVVRRGKTESLIECCPKTGRTHQIRVHMKGLGHPILGDYQYQRHFTSSLKPTRCMLHAWKLAFVHPVTGDEMLIESAIPNEFSHLQSRVSVKSWHKQH